MSDILRCKCCNKKLCNKENFKIKYKSPVGRCKKCGTEYIIPGCHEISLFEVKEAEFQIRGWIILSVFGALIALRGCHLFGMHELGSESDSHFMAWFITILGIAIIGIALYNFVYTFTGYKKKKYDRLIHESKVRMSDEEYVSKLIKLGYLKED